MQERSPWIHPSQVLKLMASWRVGSCFFFFFAYLGKQMATLDEEAGIAAGAGGMVRGKTTRFTGYLWPVAWYGAVVSPAGLAGGESLPFTSLVERGSEELSSVDSR
jgi:hypothetical protein